jgi:rod shape-determining protein MreB and related proteins
MNFSLAGMMSNDIGVDLGTANTLIWVKGRGIVLNEPSIVAIDSSSHKPLAIGLEAKEMLGRAPAEIEVIRPMKDGVIANFEMAEEMLRGFLAKVQKNRGLFRPRIVICVPSGITEVEKRAVRDGAEATRANEVHLISEPMAAAIGVGLPINKPVGSMIVDIGGGTSEIAVISLSGIVTTISERIGGDEMDEAVIQYIKRTYNLSIGNRMAEEVKMKIGSAYVLEQELETTVRGRHLVTNIPQVVVVKSEEIREALSESVDRVVHAVLQTLEKTPPELAADIIDRGIFLSGGGAMIKGLDDRLRETTNLPINIVEDPLTAVVRGTGMVLENIPAFKKVLF